MEWYTYMYVIPRIIVHQRVRYVICILASNMRIFSKWWVVFWKITKQRGRYFSLESIKIFIPRQILDILETLFPCIKSPHEGRVIMISNRGYLLNFIPCRWLVTSKKYVVEKTFIYRTQSNFIVTLYSPLKHIISNWENTPSAKHNIFLKLLLTIASTPSANICPAFIIGI